VGIGGDIVDTTFWKGKKVFITGHTGFKGAWLCLLLHRLGAEVIGYALKPPTEPSLFNLCKIDSYMVSNIGDIRDYDNLLQILKQEQPEIIIHMAAQSLVRDSYKNPVETYAINVMGTVHLLEAIRHVDSIKAVVNVTTDKCYENKEWVWGYREDEPMGGYDPYSNSKGCSELVTASYRNSFFNLNDYEQHGVAIATARAGNVIGGGDWAEDRLIPDCIRALGSGKNIRIRNPYAIRPWQHVLEPLSGYLLLAEKLYKNGSKYASGWNLGPDDSDAKTVEWIVQKLCVLWGGKVGYEMDCGHHPHEANFLKLDCSKAKRYLNWQPRWDLEHTLGKIVQWEWEYRAHQDVTRVCLQQINEYMNSED